VRKRKSLETKKKKLPLGKAKFFLGMIVVGKIDYFSQSWKKKGAKSFKFKDAKMTNAILQAIYRRQNWTRRFFSKKQNLISDFLDATL
jgi:hypothetical protein